MTTREKITGISALLLLVGFAFLTKPVPESEAERIANEPSYSFFELCYRLSGADPVEQTKCEESEPIPAAEYKRDPWF